MNDSLDNCLEGFFQCRVESIIHEIEKEEQVLKVRNFIRCLQAELIEKCDTEARLKFIEYEDELNKYYGLLIERIYKKAFKDALKIKSKFNEEP